MSNLPAEYPTGPPSGKGAAPAAADERAHFGATVQPTVANTPHAVSYNGHPHGRPISWAVVGVAVAAFAVGGLALTLNAWVLFAVCAVIVVLTIPVGVAVHIMDDTVGWSQATPTTIYPGHIIREATRIYVEEHKRPPG